LKEKVEWVIVLRKTQLAVNEHKIPLGRIWTLVLLILKLAGLITSIIFFPVFCNIKTAFLKSAAKLAAIFEGFIKAATQLDDTVGAT
jgi:hypothetical protein